MGSTSAIIDLTDSFTLANQCNLFDADVVIDLVADDSFDLSSCKNTIPNVNKNNLSTDKRQDADLALTTSKKLQDKNMNKFGDCPICFEEIGNNPLASTMCGHVYCLKCLQNALKVENRCPTCRLILKGKKAYHPLYLSNH